MYAIRSYYDINVSGKAGIINYRYHIKGGLNSFFVGAFSRYRIYSGEGNLNNTPFNFDLKECTIGANFGKRWIFKNGLNIKNGLSAYLVNQGQAKVYLHGC